MATRFYLDSTTAPTLSPSFTADWEHNTQAVRLRLNRTKQSSAMTTKQTTVDTGGDHIADQDNLFFQYICNTPLAAQTISALQTIKLQIRAAEDNAGNNLFVTLKLFLVDGSASPVSDGTILAITRDLTEVATSLTNRQFTAITGVTGITVPDNSYLVAELGLGGLPVAAGGTQDHDGSLRVGDAAASDLSEDDTSTTDNNPWLEFTDNLVFNEGQPTIMRNYGIPTGPFRKVGGWN